MAGQPGRYAASTRSWCLERPSGTGNMEEWLEVGRTTSAAASKIFETHPKRAWKGVFTGTSHYGFQALCGAPPWLSVATAAKSIVLRSGEKALDSVQLQTTSHLRPSCQKHQCSMLLSFCKLPKKTFPEELLKYPDKRKTMTK